MKTLKALKTRREGIEKINKIARAMEVIAATRLHRCETALERFRPFIQVQDVITKNLALRLKKVNSLWVGPVAQNRKGLIILISSDRGFCGGFNNQLFQLVEEFSDVQSFSFIAIGRKGARFIKRQHYNLIDEFALPEDKQISDFVRGLSERIISSYRDQRYMIHLIFNKFRRHLLGRASSKQLFPLEIPQEKEIILDYLSEPNLELILERFLPLYVCSQVKAAILESQAAEEMARMVTMTQARRNAEDLIRSLNLEYHKARQSGITKELIEIVSAI